MIGLGTANLGWSRSVETLGVLHLATVVSMLWVTALVGTQVASVPVTAFTLKVFFPAGLALSWVAYGWSVWSGRLDKHQPVTSDTSVTATQDQTDWALVLVAVCVSSARLGSEWLWVSALACGVYWAGSTWLSFRSPFAPGRLPAVLALVIAPFVLTSLMQLTIGVPIFILCFVISMAGLHWSYRSKNVTTIMQYLPCMLLVSTLYNLFINEYWFLVPILVFIFFLDVYMLRNMVIKIKKWINDEIRRLLIGLTILCVFMLLVNTDPTWDPTHYGYYLFPARDVLLGKSPLLDINHQYGIGTLYLIAFLGRIQGIPLDYWSLAVWVNLLNVALAAMVLLVAYRGPQGRWSAGLLLPLLIWGKFAQQDSPDRFPSVGFMRFGLTMLLVIACSWRAKGRTSHFRWWTVTTVLSASSLYSLEAFLYSIVIVGADQTAEAIRWWRDGWAKKKLYFHLAKSASIRTMSIVLAHAGFSATIRVTSGAWPDWRHYTQYLDLYAGGFGFWPPSATDPWSLLLLTCVVGGVWAIDVLVRSSVLTTRDFHHARLVLVVSAAGIVQFTYFVYRPHLFNLFHIMWPSILLYLWGLSYLLREKHINFAPAVRVIIVGGVLSWSMLTARAIVHTTNNASQTMLGWFGRQMAGMETSLVPWGVRPPDVQNAEAAEFRAMLLASHTGSARIPMLVGADLLEVALLTTPYVNWFPISYPEQDGLIPLTREIMIDAAMRVAPGTLLILERERGKYGVRTTMPCMEALCKRGYLSQVVVGERLVLARFEVDQSQVAPDVCDIFEKVAP